MSSWTMTTPTTTTAKSSWSRKLLKILWCRWSLTLKLRCAQGLKRSLNLFVFLKKGGGGGVRWDGARSPGATDPWDAEGAAGSLSLLFLLIEFVNFCLLLIVFICWLFFLTTWSAGRQQEGESWDRERSCGEDVYVVHGPSFDLEAFAECSSLCYLPYARWVRGGELGTGRPLRGRWTSWEGAFRRWQGGRRSTWSWWRWWRRVRELAPWPWWLDLPLQVCQPTWQADGLPTGGRRQHAGNRDPVVHISLMSEEALSVSLCFFLSLITFLYQRELDQWRKENRELQLELRHEESLTAQVIGSLVFHFLHSSIFPF